MANATRHSRRYADPTYRKKTKARVRDYEQRNPEWRRKVVANELIRLRDAVLDAYGGACSCCGLTYRPVLALDHTRGDGAEHRRKINRRNVYREVRRAGFPKDGYRLLCHNCNWCAYLNGGTCLIPHVRLS